MKSSVTRTLRFSFWNETEPYASPLKSPAYPCSISAQAFRSSFGLASMNSLMSGCQTLSVFIFAARRVLPPDFTTLAIASYTFRNDSGPLGRTAARKFLARAAQRRQVRAGAAAVLEQHRFAARQFHDVFHRVADGLDEAGRALRILVLRRGALDGSRVAIEMETARAAVLADAVLAGTARS